MMRLLVLALLLSGVTGLCCAEARPPAGQRDLEERWLFVWPYRDMRDPAQVDRTIALFPRAHAAGHNAVVLPSRIASAKVADLREAAERYELDLIPLVMDDLEDMIRRWHDPNCAEGLPVEGAVFVVEDGHARFQQDPPITLRCGGFEEVKGDRFGGWTFQEDEGQTLFADHAVVHSGSTSARMEDIGRKQQAYNMCRVAQPLTVKPFRQYHLSFWLKTEGLVPGRHAPNAFLLDPETERRVTFERFQAEPTQDWTHYEMTFNSLENSDVMLYVGLYGGDTGRAWWDDVALEEVGLVNVLRRPGCPLTVRSEAGQVYEEGRDFERVEDPNLDPWDAYHEPPAITLTSNSRISDGERLRVSYHHPVMVHRGRLTACLSDPYVFAKWREQVQEVEEALHPRAFFLCYDEIRVANWCASCRSHDMTTGELLAWSIREAARMVREIRPDAQIWVWNDMFDPQHNAQDDYFHCRGTVRGSWEGLDPSIGIVNWSWMLKGANCKFFADRGHRQVLAGYYDKDPHGALIQEWLASAEGLPGIVGAMYTSWQEDYSSMERWAEAAWGHEVK